MAKRISLHPLGLPLGWQLFGIIIGALIVAQLVTLLLTLLLPPAAPRTWDLGAVAESLLGQAEDPKLERRVLSGRPDIGGGGWLVSESSRQALAKRLGQPEGDVVLAFYTQLPVGGISLPVDRPTRPLEEAGLEEGAGEFSFTLIPSADAQAMPGGPPPGGVPAGVPGGGFPGGGFPSGPPRGGLPPGAPSPSGGIPGGSPAPGSGPATAGGGGAPPTTTPQPPPAASGPQSTAPAPPPSSRPEAGAPPAPAAPAASAPGAPSAPPNALQAGSLSPSGPPTRDIASPATDAQRATLSTPGPRTQIDQIAGAVAVIPENVPGPVSASAQTGQSAPAEGAASVSRLQNGAAVPIPFRQEQSILSFTTPPFIEGDFIAAMKQADGTWVAVAPRAEPFPNHWQKRVLLWFVLSLLIVGPFIWIFARRIVRPLEQFAGTAEALGRNPGASTVPLAGPAEIGRAARAFNQMQSRLRAFVDDRTMMVGAISHDLRTPLTRMRFRVEDLPDDQREALLGEVEEMEAMITQVISFIRDASAAGPRETVDFGILVEDTVRDARVAGASIEIGRIDRAAIDADIVGLRRVLTNLLDNASKYGTHARVRVSLSGGEAFAEVIDDGPGVVEEELEQVFDPFYRCQDARDSGKSGSGLGLAVCRSIARAHGGDVTLSNTSEGFVARLTLPVVLDSSLAEAA